VTAPAGYDFVLVDVFSEVVFGGNQLAVLPHAQGLSAAQMQSIAREFNFAETAFVLPAEDDAHTHRLRIFSPAREMPFAGHPTVGAAAVLAHLSANDADLDLVLGEQVGPVGARVTSTRGRLYSELILHPTLDEPSIRPETGLCAQALSLSTDVVLRAWFASVGLRFCFIQLATAGDVDAATPDLSALTTGFAGAWTSTLFVFSGDPVDGGEIYARMFAPGLSIQEDPATGSAAAALAAYAAARDLRPDLRSSFCIVQGEKIGRRSEMSVRADKAHGRVVTVTVGGAVTVVGAGVLELPTVGDADAPPGAR
jgi:trans-2,3-dihydro-3-hydroxyanthranilate isomerase